MIASLRLTHRSAFFAIACAICLSCAGIILRPDANVGATALLAFALVWASAVDIDRMILPNAITYGLIVAGLSMHVADGVAAMAPFVAGAVAGYSLLWLGALCYQQRRRRSGLGMGDAKLFAAAGAWLGWIALPSVMIIAAVSALVFVCVKGAVTRRFDANAAIPFGPFISAGFWVIWFTGPYVG